MSKDDLMRAKSPTIAFGKAPSKASMISQSEKKPGPGEYNVTPTKASVSYTISGAKNNEIRDSKNGPGAYQPNVDYVKEKVKTFKMGNAPPKTSLAQSKSTANIPGPGNYTS